MESLLKRKGIFGYNWWYLIRAPHVIIREALYRIKWAYQRVVRGWDDRVILSIDIYLADMLPLWLSELKKNNLGVPVSYLRDDLSLEESINAYYRNIDKMIAGFVAYKKIVDFEYKDLEEHAEYMETFKEGMGALTKDFHNLWT